MAALPPSPLMLVGAVIAVIGAGLIIVSLVLAFGRRLRTDFPALDLLIAHRDA